MRYLIQPIADGFLWKREGEHLAPTTAAESGFPENLLSEIRRFCAARQTGDYTAYSGNEEEARTAGVRLVARARLFLRPGDSIALVSPGVQRFSATSPA